MLYPAKRLWTSTVWLPSALHSVELFTKPELHLEDVFVKQSFADDFSSATVTFDCKVSGAGTVSVVFDGEEQSAEVGEPAEYDSGVVLGKGEVAPDVEEDVQDVSLAGAQSPMQMPALRWKRARPLHFPSRSKDKKVFDQSGRHRKDCRFGLFCFGGDFYARFFTKNSRGQGCRRIPDVL
mgnify:CR=1 FL=1